MANRMTPPAEGQEKGVLLILDKQQGKVSAVKGIDKDGTVYNRTRNCCNARSMNTGSPSRNRYLPI